MTDNTYDGVAVAGLLGSVQTPAAMQCKPCDSGSNNVVLCTTAD